MLTTLWWYLRNRWTEDEGQGMVEYGLILALVAVGAVGLLYTLGGNVSSTLQSIVDAFTNPGGGS